MLFKVLLYFSSVFAREVKLVVEIARHGNRASKKLFKFAANPAKDFLEPE